MEVLLVVPEVVLNLSNSSRMLGARASENATDVDFQIPSFTMP